MLIDKFQLLIGHYMQCLNLNLVIKLYLLVPFKKKITSNHCLSLMIHNVKFNCNLIILSCKSKQKVSASCQNQTKP